MFQNALFVAEKAHMPQLIHFIIADGLYRHLHFNVLNIVKRGTHSGQPGTGIADF